jgi:Flp pilus assembly protein TadG
MKINLVKSLLRGEEGQQLVEFSMISSALIAVTFILLQFGVYMNQYLQLNHAAIVGARTLAVNGGIALDPCAVTSAAVIAAAPGLKSSQLTFTYSLNGNPESGTSCAAGSITAAPASYLKQGTTATLNLSYPLNLAHFGHYFLANNAVLKASATELVQ